MISFNIRLVGIFISALLWTTQLYILNNSLQVHFNGKKYLKKAFKFNIKYM